MTLSNISNNDMSDTALSKSAQITALVADFKNGQISKAELFSRLQLLQGGNVTATPQPIAAPALEQHSKVLCGIFWLWRTAGPTEQ